MKEQSFDNKVVNQISNQIWRIFDLLRGELSSDDFHIVLFLLTLKRIGFKSDLLLKSAENQVIVYDFLKSFDQTNKSSTLDTFNVYDPLLYRLSKEKLIELFAIIDTVDSGLLEDNFIRVFDNILYRLLESLGKFSGEFVMPLELGRFMTSLVSLPKNAKIYNPFAGAASFSVLANGQNEYLGQEINQTIWVIGKLRLLASGFSNNKRIILGDSIKEWNPYNLKYDLIIASPPFGGTIPSGISGRFGTIRKFESFFIEKGLEDLKEDGKLIALVSESFLFSSGALSNLRYHLIEEDLIESIISLPIGTLHYAAIKTSVLVINKAKKNRGFINFIDADDFVTKDRNRFKILDDKSLIDIIHAGIETNCYKKVSIDVIKNSDRLLDCQRYFLKDFHGVKLQNFATLVRGTRTVLSDSVKWVKIKDLMDDSLNFYLDLDKVDEVELTRSAGRIDESCILISKMGSSLKPTFFQFVGTPIVISHEILALRIDEKIASPIFITMELYKDYVIEQTEALKRGSNMNSLMARGIQNIKFNLPSIPEQKGQVETYLDLSAKLNDLELQRENLKKGFNKLQFDEFASLKHSLGTPRQNLLSNSKTLIRFFEKEDSEEFKKIDLKFRERYDASLLEVFNQVKNDINQISIILEKGENGLIVGNYEKELVPLQDINTFINELSTNSFNFKIDRRLLQLEDCSDKDVEINITLLKILFDNILTNAHKYGFDAIEETNTVMIELAVVENQLEIAIKNNGKPFPKNFNKEKFISKFSTANSDKGTGIGGYDINRIATYFGNDDWTLELNSNPLYPIIFKFLLPLKNAINEQ
jgi:type I restriction enzyme M protein